jgi:hypothetical protein
MAIQVKQGEDVRVILSLVDNENKPLDLTTATKVRMGLYIKDSLLTKYAEQTLEPLLTMYKELTFSGNAVTFDILRAESKAYPVGTMTASFLIEFPDVDLTSIRRVYDYDFGTMLAGNLTEETL